MLQTSFHMFLHAAIPALTARVLYPQRWLFAWGVMLAAMLVDLDHLLADPVFDPQRCSIGFHPLHSAPAIAGYLAALAVPKARLLALGLLIHMLVDALDCLWMRWA